MMTIDPRYDRVELKDNSFYKTLQSRTRVEEDPNGWNSSTPGAKLDHGKPDLDLVLGDFSRALLEVGRVGTYGAAKYSRSGWRSVPNGIGRYMSALLRHYFYYREGEKRDVETDLLHLSHAAWNALAALELTLIEMEKEDDHTNYVSKSTHG